MSEAAPITPYPTEHALAIATLGLSSEEAARHPWVRTHTAIIASFTQRHAKSGTTQLLSLSRAAAIPAITRRWMQVVAPYRYGDRTPTAAEVRTEWEANTPQYRAGRHPDELFDMAHLNFGHDGPILWLEQGIMAATRRREAVLRAYGGEVLQVIGELAFGNTMDADAGLYVTAEALSQPAR